MTMEPAGNTEQDRLLQEVKRTILDNRSFLETLKQEPFSDGGGAEEEPSDAADEGAFEEL